jgi:predicted enzyme related to lactoylglutathione lyase
METVEGIGGVFIYAAQPAALAKWYADHLGIATTHYEAEDIYYRDYLYCDPSDPDREIRSVWAIVPAGDTPRGSGRSFMINYRVKNLDVLLEQLRQAGVTVERTQDEAYGRFAWLTDPEGNQVELFEELVPE